MIEELPKLKDGTVYYWGSLSKYFQQANLVIVNGKTVKDRWYWEELSHHNLQNTVRCTAKWYPDIRVLKVDWPKENPLPKGIKIEISYL